VHAIDVPPTVVRAVEPRELNVVLQRPLPPPVEKLDLVVATNVLVYYGPFEQALAQLNIASMLRPGGWLLSNTALVELPDGPLTAVGGTDAPYADGVPGNRIYWYRHR
jgi:hypothetical protein